MNEEVKMEPEETYIEILHEVDGVSEWCWRDGDVSGFQGPAIEWPTIRDTILKHTKGRDLIIQAGGCCGMYPRLWSKYFNTVHTFEPVAANFYCLCENCPDELNIHKHACALGDSNKYVKLQGGKEFNIYSQSEQKNVGMYHVIGTFDSGVYQLKIDDLNLDKLDAIQLDVEEYEYNVLKGAVQTIHKFFPTICVETYDDKTKELLKSYGYSVIDRAERDYVLTHQEGWLI